MDFQPTVSPSRLRSFRMPNINVRSIKAYVRQNKKVLALAAVGIFLFFWFEVRPIQVNNACALDASANARALLQSKAQVTTDAAMRASYQSLAQQNLYLRNDYEAFFRKCMRSHGFNQI